MLVFIVFMILQSYRKSNCFTHSGTPSLCALPYDKHVIIDWSEFFMILEPLERVDTKKQMMNHRFQRREKMHNITIARFSHPWNALIRRNEWWIVDFKGVKTASYNLLWSCHMGEHKDWGVLGAGFWVKQLRNRLKFEMMFCNFERLQITFTMSSQPLKARLTMWSSLCT